MTPPIQPIVEYFGWIPLKMKQARVLSQHGTLLKMQWMLWSLDGMICGPLMLGNGLENKKNLKFNCYEKPIKHRVKIGNKN